MAGGKGSRPGDPATEEGVTRATHGVTLRISREGLRWRYNAQLVVGGTLLCADGRCATEGEAREICERLAAGLVRVLG